MSMGGTTREFSHWPENLDLPDRKHLTPSAGRITGLFGAILLIAVVTAIMWITGCAGLTSGTAKTQTPTNPDPAPTPTTPTVSVAQDQYGGRKDIMCAQTTGSFHPEKIGNRWWLCTPLGNAFFLQGVAAWITPTSPKYNNDQNAAAVASINEFNSWGFNAVGELSFGLVEPVSTCQGCTKLPEIQTLNVSNYAAANLWNYAQRPMKNLLWGLNGNYVGWRASTMDFFEPQFGPWLDGYFANDQGFLGYKSSPYFVGVMLDDTDWFWGMGAGPDFHTVPPGHTNAHVGYMVLITSPVQTFNPDPASRGIPELYADTKVYSKTAMATPPATCSIATPCSLRDYLYKKYNGSITALNTAWGSNYTTFDSTGTQVTGEAIATGSGTTTVFTGTLAHTQISPETMVLNVGGTAQAADCPGFNSSCNISTPQAGTFGGTSGSTLLVGEEAWNSNIIFSAGTSGYPQASFWSVLVYHFPSGTNEVGVPSRLVGETDSNGQQPQVIGPAGDPEGLASGYDVYMACRMVTGAAQFGCAAGGSAIPTPTLQATNVPLNTNWSVPSTGLVIGASIPGSPSFINYTTGQYQLTFKTAPASGQQITTNYIYGGWTYGTGLMDEDGRNTAWVGSNAICLTPATACDGKDYPAPNANATLGADLDAWVPQIAGQYFGTLSKHLKAAAPNMPYFGADTTGTWGAPPRKEILAGAAPFVDGVFTQWYPDQPDATTAGQMYAYLTKYLGDKPLMNFLTLCANPDSAMSASGLSGCFSTQTARGQEWLNTTTGMLNTLSSNNSYPWVGTVWWGSHDFNGANGEFTDWGLKTPSDNAYDGREAVTATVACSAPLQNLTCGREKANYGDVITSVRTANLLWLTIP